MLHTDAEVERAAAIPSQRDRKEQRVIDRHLYRERFWSKAKQCRRIATRYGKAANFLAFVKVAAMMAMLK